jgi:hypothetical protein
MKRVVWLTDIHLNFLTEAKVKAFLAEVDGARPDAVLIGGDIGEAHDVCDYLGQIGQAIAVPVYFVLGNHDFYHGSIRETRRRVAELCAGHPRLHYLTVEDHAELAPHVGLVGHDGWADGRLGNYARSLVAMNDFRLISELTGRDKLDRWEACMRRFETRAISCYDGGPACDRSPGNRLAANHEIRDLQRDLSRLAL